MTRRRMQLDGLTTIQNMSKRQGIQKKTQNSFPYHQLILDLWIPSSSFRRSSAISASKDFNVSAEDCDACRMRLG